MDTPQNKRLEEADTRYEAGDYKVARRLALALDEDPSLKESDRARVRRILTATQSDPVVIMAIVFSLCVLIFLVLKYAL